MVMELRLEGALMQEEDLDGFLDWLKEFAIQHQIQAELYQEQVLLKICPYGDVEISWEGKYLTCSAAAQMLGPGFYAYVCDLFTDLKAESDIEWELYDPCGYTQNHDFEAMRFQYFYPFLSALKEMALSYQEESIYLCGQYEEYLPLPKKGCAVTMMGYLSLDELRKMDVEAFADRFYIWNDLGLNAKFYRNCAQVLLWNACRYEYTNMNEEGLKAAEQIISYLEAAYDRDNTLPLYYQEYLELCDLLQVKPLIEQANRLEPLDGGYRRGLVLRNLEGWNVWLDGMGTLFYDKSASRYSFLAPYYDENDDWNYFIQFSSESMILPEDAQIEQGACELRYVQSAGEDGYEMHVLCTQEAAQLSFQVLAKNKSDLDMILDWMRLIVYRKGGEE